MLGPIFTTLHRDRSQISPSSGIVFKLRFVFFPCPWRFLGLFQLLARSRFAFQCLSGRTLFLRRSKRIE